jgi:hypothetical protein
VIPQYRNFRERFVAVLPTAAYSTFESSGASSSAWGPYQLIMKTLSFAVINQILLTHWATVDRGAAVLLQDREDVLEEIELLVAGARPKIAAVDDERFLRGLACFVDDGDAALLAEGRIGQDDVIFDSRSRFTVNLHVVT